MELTRKNFHAMIYYDFRRVLSRNECIDQLISSFGVKPHPMPLWKASNEFNRGRHSVTDEFRKGRPKCINALQKLIMQDRRVTYCEIEATLGISSTSIYKILHEHLARKKICSR